WVDTLARTVLDPQEVPVGVVTSLIGVPVFVLAPTSTRPRRPRARGTVCPPPAAPAPR
ncbi:iron chelate uptake ABC transporter family permease subunit, partial [Streptomyces phaeochromogenes]|uniref:iron chelate uptake ABC transporter family permease subunit n=1 Tax=Streptomyces phaeochromogenes TaxID=1923 RepID=UPI00340C5C50